MKTIISGLIKYSTRKEDQKKWMAPLEGYLDSISKTPEYWEIFSTGSFWVEVTKAEALSTAIHIQSILRSFKGMSLKMVVNIGIEPEETAYLQADDVDPDSLMFNSTRKVQDDELNMMAKLAMVFIKGWTPTTSGTIQELLKTPKVSQAELAQFFNVSQPAISERLERAHTDELFDFLNYYQKKFSKTIKLTENK